MENPYKIVERILCFDLCVTKSSDLFHFLHDDLIISKFKELNPYLFGGNSSQILF